MDTERGLNGTRVTRTQRRKQQIQQEIQKLDYPQSQEGGPWLEQDRGWGEGRVLARLGHWQSCCQDMFQQLNFQFERLPFVLRLSKTERGERHLKIELESRSPAQVELQFEAKLVWVSNQGRLQSKAFRGRRKMPILVGVTKVQSLSDVFVDLGLLKLRKIQPHGFTGLVNQGNTCYMNSFLQALFHTKVLCRAVFRLRSQKNKFPSTLQHLFFKLMKERAAVSTENLCRSYGWNRKQSWQQQDIQQFIYLFFQVLQKKLDQNPQTKNVLPDYFHGKMLNYIKCLYVDHSSQSQEKFLDLQLPINGLRGLADSLNALTAGQQLSGENQWSTERYGRQDAVKGMRLKQLPPVFMLHLKRFEFDPVEMGNVKLMGRYEYPPEMDFSPWVQSPTKSQLYRLFAVLVHEGLKAGSGHYYSYIRKDDCWFRFNDQQIEKVSEFAVFEQNFGGVVPQLIFNKTNMQAEFREVPLVSTAYMLIYVRAHDWFDILRELSPEEMQVSSIIEEEEQKVKQQLEQKAKEEARGFIFVSAEVEYLEGRQATGGVFYKRAANEQAIYISYSKQVYCTVARSRLVQELFQQISAQTGLMPSQFSLWHAEENRGKEHLRPITPDSLKKSLAEEFSLTAKSDDPVIILVLAEKPLTIISEGGKNRFKFIEHPAVMAISPAQLKEFLVVFIKIFRGGKYTMVGPVFARITSTYAELKAEVEREFNLRDSTLFVEYSLLEVKTVEFLEGKVHPVNLMRNQEVILHLVESGEIHTNIVPTGLAVSLIDSEDNETLNVVLPPETTAKQIIVSLPGDPNKIILRYKKNKGGAKNYREAAPDTRLDDMVRLSRDVFWVESEVDTSRRNQFTAVSYEFHELGFKIEVPLKISNEQLEAMVSEEVGEAVVLLRLDRAKQRILQRLPPDEQIKTPEKNKLVAVPREQGVLVFVQQKARTGELIGFPFHFWVLQHQNPDLIQRRTIQRLQQLKMGFQGKPFLVEVERLRLQQVLKTSSQRRGLGVVERVRDLLEESSRAITVEVVHGNVAKNPALSINVD